MITAYPAHCLQLDFATTVERQCRMPHTSSSKNFWMAQHQGPAPRWLYSQATIFSYKTCPWYRTILVIYTLFLVSKERKTFFKFSAHIITWGWKTYTSLTCHTGLKRDMLKITREVLRTRGPPTGPSTFLIFGVVTALVSLNWQPISSKHLGKTVANKHNIHEEIKVR